MIVTTIRFSINHATIFNIFLGEKRRKMKAWNHLGIVRIFLCFVKVVSAPSALNDETRAA